jgi:ribonuclease P protein component
VCSLARARPKLALGFAKFSTETVEKLRKTVEILDLPVERLLRGLGYSTRTSALTPHCYVCILRRLRRTSISEMRGSHETNISAKQPPPGQDARISGPDEHEGGAARAQAAQGQGTQTPDAGSLLNGSGDLEGETAQASESEAFRKVDRLLSRSSFRRVYERGRKIHTRFFTAFVLDSNSDRIRLGLTATRRVGKAVDRNRCRRVLREAFRRRRNEAGGTALDIVINVKRELITAPYQDVETEVVKLLARYRR